MIFQAPPAEVGEAVGRMRERMGALKEPRLYQLAVVLTVLLRRGEATSWDSWDAVPPATGLPIRKSTYIGTMWDLFGVAADALLQPDSLVRSTLQQPSRVLLDVFYHPGDELTVVSDRPGPGGKQNYAAKLKLDHAAWVWATVAESVAPPRTVEYNPVNTRNQQNGVWCALPPSMAMSLSPADPSGVYALRRNDCPYRQEAGRQRTCALNDEQCGGSGDDEAGARQKTKPRLLAPLADGVLVLPGSVEALVARAQGSDGVPLPQRKDLSLLASWCHRNGKGPFNQSRLMDLLGFRGINLLTS